MSTPSREPQMLQPQSKKPTVLPTVLPAVLPAVLLLRSESEAPAGGKMVFIQQRPLLNVQRPVLLIWRPGGRDRMMVSLLVQRHLLRLPMRMRDRKWLT